MYTQPSHYQMEEMASSRNEMIFFFFFPFFYEAGKRKDKDQRVRYRLMISLKAFPFLVVKLQMKRKNPLGPPLLFWTAQ